LDLETETCVEAVETEVCGPVEVPSFFLLRLLIVFLSSLTELVNLPAKAKKYFCPGYFPEKR